MTSTATQRQNSAEAAIRRQAGQSDEHHFIVRAITRRWISFVPS